MLTETNLQELLGYQTQSQVLSIYLNTNPIEGGSDVYKQNLRSMLKDIKLTSDVTAVDNFFSRDYDWSGRSVAVFSCARDGFFRAYSLAIPIRNQLVIGDRPYVKPLASLLDNYGGYGVVLVDKQGARLFSFHLGELKEQEGILGESVRHTKRGGASAKPGMRGGMTGQTRYEEEVADRNMRDVADFAAHFLGENNVRRVLIGGTEENIALLRSQLPKNWQSLIVGIFPMSMTASKDEVLERAMQIGMETDFRREEQLLKKLVTGAAKERRAVLNLDETLGAVHDGKVQVLVIMEGYREKGYRCLGCGYVTARELSVCQYCGSNFEQIPDAVEMAVYKVMKAGGEVEVLQHHHVINGFENIGALLRY
jgi:peptide subunit release factor 1 (eRF1)